MYRDLYRGFTGKSNKKQINPSFFLQYQHNIFCEELSERIFHGRVLFSLCLQLQMGILHPDVA